MEENDENKMSCRDDNERRKQASSQTMKTEGTGGGAGDILSRKRDVGTIEREELYDIAKMQKNKEAFCGRRENGS